MKKPKTPQQPIQGYCKDCAHSGDVDDYMMPCAKRKGYSVPRFHSCKEFKKKEK